MLVKSAGSVNAATTPIMPRVMRTSANVKAVFLLVTLFGFCNCLVVVELKVDPSPSLNSASRVTRLVASSVPFASRRERNA